MLLWQDEATKAVDGSSFEVLRVIAEVTTNSVKTVSTFK